MDKNQRVKVSYSSPKTFMGISLALLIILSLLFQTAAISATTKQFDAKKALCHINFLSKNIGLRSGGATGEKRAIEYIKNELASYGYKVVLQKVPLPNKKSSSNVIAYLPGNSSKTILIGGHIDSKGGPGANDNASGVGTILELARISKLIASRPYSLKFVLFAAEERIGSNANSHHFGSRHFVKYMNPTDRRSLLEMLNVDMVGYGSVLCCRAFGVKPSPYVQSLINFARNLKINTQYKKAGDDSDFEAFERAGIKTVWLEWRYDSNWHTKHDTADKINLNDIAATGKLLERYISSPAKK